MTLPLHRATCQYIHISSAPAFEPDEKHTYRTGDEKHTYRTGRTCGQPHARNSF